MSTGHGAILTTLPDKAGAEALARLLVEERLAACVQILPIESVYRWDGAVRKEGEILLLAKTRAVLFDAVIARIKAAHPYSVPEIVALPFAAGFAGYLGWIDAETSP